MNKQSQSQSQKVLRCAIYTRKSIAKGLDQDFNSLDSQLDYCMKFIERNSENGWVHVGTYCDAAVSGTTVEREQLTRLRQQVKAGALDYVVVYKLDRLSRDLTDFAVLMKEFVAHGVTFVSATQALEAHTPEGKLSMNMMAVVADYEAAMIRARIRDKLRATRAQGRWVGGRPPIGYSKGKSGLRIHAKEAETVRLIYTLFQRGEPMAQIARVLNQGGHEVRTRTSGKWAGELVRRVLTNPTYAGLLKDEDKLIPGIHVPIIPQDVWHEVQKRLAENSISQPAPAARPVFPLRGILVCGGCGRDYVGVRGLSKGKRWRRYYICASASSKATESCGNPRFPADALEAMLVRYVATFRKDQQLLIALLERMDDEDARTITDCFNSLDMVLDKHSAKELLPVMQSVFRKVAINANGRQLDIQLRNFPDRKDEGLPRDFPLAERMAALSLNASEQKPALWADKHNLSEQLADVEVPPGFDFSIPIIRERDKENCISLRVRTREDDLIESAAGEGQRPTKRAIRMANAIMMERILTSGRFSSAREFSEALGVSQPVVSNALKMLNLPPDEIERILFEVR